MNDSIMLPGDIIVTHIVPHLDGETLITLSLVSSEFFHLIWKNNNKDLWKNICISTWPSLLSNGSLWLSEMISMFAGGDYRSFLFDAFLSLHRRNNPLPTPPIANFTYTVDIFLHGEREPLYTNIHYQHINTQLKTRFSSMEPYFELSASNLINYNLKFFTVKKDGCKEYLKEELRLSCVQEYLKEKLRLSCVLIYYDLISSTKRAWGLFSSSCNPVSVTTNKRWVEAVYEKVMPAGLHGYCGRFYGYTKMVKFKVHVKCGWRKGIDKFYVKGIEFRMEDMNGMRLLEEDAAIVLLKAIENGERRTIKFEVASTLDSNL